MRHLKYLPLMLAAALGACVIAPSTTELVPAQVQVETVVTDARLAFIGITGALPEEGGEGLPPALLDSLMENTPVRLDLTINPPLEVTAKGEDGFYHPLTECAFGPLDAGEVSVPTGSNHMLLDVRLGARETFAANLLSCEYAPAVATQESPGTAVRVRGCFLPQPVSIPTAVQWVLSPLPASACGIGD